MALLSRGDASVGELAAPHEMSLQAVSKHLRVLQQAGLVTRSRESQRRPAHLEAEMLDLMTKWLEKYRRTASERYERNDAVLLTQAAGGSVGSTTQELTDQELKDVAS